MGSAVVAVYDKAVEYISGARMSRTSSRSSGAGNATTTRRPNRASPDGFHILLKQSEIDMHDLGAFGGADGFEVPFGWRDERRRDKMELSMMGGMGGGLCAGLQGQG